MYIVHFTLNINTRHKINICILMPDIIANNLHGRPLNTLTEVLISSWLPPPLTNIHILMQQM